MRSEIDKEYNLLSHSKTLLCSHGIADTLLGITVELHYSAE